MVRGYSDLSGIVEFEAIKYCVIYCGLRLFSVGIFCVV